ncbi:MAG: DUF5103 domain-containing protein [Bacteroidales bacterium]|nr:DUF5103 domain-containing protein [Bacteroidales bacterium]HOY38613.1 DUF5103 domain-containing protein [Bacteroidales bacterium]
MKRKSPLFILLAALLMFFSFTVYGTGFENLEYRNKVYVKFIHSVRMTVGGWEVAYPVLAQDSDTYFEFSFDDIEADVKDYYYTVVHCKSDWTPSDLQYFEYASGFEENPVRNYQASRNTLLQYTHYSIELPNEDLQLNYSGNYLLVVYTNDDEGKKLVCSYRFMLYENKMPITGGVYQPTGAEYSTGQKVSFIIDRRNYPLYNPFVELNVVVIQNNDWSTAKTKMEPMFVKSDELVFDIEDKQIFSGSNEFRYFSTRNLKILMDKIRSVEYHKPYYFVELFSESSRYFDKYSSVEDINGCYVIKSEEETVIDNNTDADYTFVHFVLKTDMLTANRKIYVYGALTNWEFDEWSEMKYNKDLKGYELLLLLKQGYYNYRYVLAADGQFDNVHFEGSFWQTENDYQIFVYHNDISAGYERLVGYNKISSRNR